MSEDTDSPFDRLVVVLMIAAAALYIEKYSRSKPTDETDLFSSIEDMEALVEHEDRLLVTVRKYLEFAKSFEKLETLQLKLEEISNIRPPEMTTEEVIGDPISAYSLVRRLTKDWPELLELVITNIGNSREITEEFRRLPRRHILESAKRSLTRLQEVYSLNTMQLTSTSKNFKLTALDCFELGKYTLRNRKFNISVQWFREALERVEIEGHTLREDTIIPHLILADFFKGCDNGTRSAGDTKDLEDMMSKYHNYGSDLETARFFKLALSTECPIPKPGFNRVSEESQRIEEFETICRSGNIPNSSKLRCFYIHHNNPSLLIAPFKMEEQNLDPPILMFHDVITDQEITDMKAEFVKVRTRCTIEEAAPTTYRMCDVGWVEDEVTPTSARLTRRAGDMTNLNMETSEPNQVASYGLGGVYQPHLDAFNPIPEEHDGNRLATLMFYLNDVESGGNTVFTELNVSIKPQKGSAVFWFNLDHESDILDTMMHGGCPVLQGSKYVINTWIHEAKQTNEMFCPADMKFPKPRYYLKRKKTKKWNGKRTY